MEEGAERERSGGTRSIRTRRQKKRKGQRKEAEQAEPGQSLAPERRERDEGRKLYESSERFDIRILEEVFSRPWVS